jgi:molybdopterin/thiamine biosynthesis adenylyltransferase
MGIGGCKMKKILICGLGGVGSYLSRELNRLILKGQIDSTEYVIYVMDYDSVEDKNVRYSDFEPGDLFKSKASVIEAKYLFISIEKKIESGTDLEGYDLIVCAVDNPKAREIVFKYCLKNSVPFIDLRAEGRNWAYFTQLAPEKELYNSLGKDITEKGASCQLAHDLANNRIENGNVIIATIGSQLILNWTRGESSPASFIHRV